MSGESLPELTVYHCLECGPVLREWLNPNRHITRHKATPRPLTNMDQAEENLPTQ